METPDAFISICRCNIFCKYYVSLGSLAVVIIYLIEIIVYGKMGGFGMQGAHLMEMYIIAALLMLSAFYKHKENIKRLLAGTENKLSVGKNK